MSYEEKLERASKVLEEYNNAVTKKSRQICPEDFISNLKGAGGINEELLSQATWEDIEACGPATMPLPRLLSKKIAEIFRERPQKEGGRKFITARRSEEMSLQELFASYNPKEPNDNVGKRLSDLSAGKPCVVFGANGLVDVSTSASLLEEIMDGFEPRETTIVENVPQRILKIGDRPASKVDENPLFPGQPLRGSDLVCHLTHRPWVNVPQDIRVFLRVALECGEIKIDYPGRVHDIFDLLGDKTEEEINKVLWQRYPNSKIRYDELAEDDNLPKLKLKKNSKNKLPPQDPFHRNKKF